ncbi:MAG: YMGG-like glycine zipper-containing protein [Chitinophagaceae bacterium]
MKKLCLMAFLPILFSACNNSALKEAQAQQQHTIDSMNAVAEKQHIIDSMKMVEARHRDNVVMMQSAQTTGSSSPAATTTRKKKWNWSNTAKGAVIGAGVGAAAGALIDKRHGQGAIIGGLTGAGAGAATGLIIDKSKKNQTTTTSSQH